MFGDKQCEASANARHQTAVMLKIEVLTAAKELKQEMFKGGFKILRSLK